jgi:hypothetical protein
MIVTSVNRVKPKLQKVVRLIRERYQLFVFQHHLDEHFGNSKARLIGLKMLKF